MNTLTTILALFSVLVLFSQAINVDIQVDNNHSTATTPSLSDLGTQYVTLCSYNNVTGQNTDCSKTGQYQCNKIPLNTCTNIMLNPYLPNPEFYIGILTLENNVINTKYFYRLDCTEFSLDLPPNNCNQCYEGSHQILC